MLTWRHAPGGAIEYTVQDPGEKNGIMVSLAACRSSKEVAVMRSTKQRMAYKLETDAMRYMEPQCHCRTCQKSAPALARRTRNC